VTEMDQARVRERYSLPARYLFYPAQFWPHKNHRRIIEALGALREREGLRIPIVFCGSHSGKVRKETFNEAMAMAKRLGVADQIQYLGYVPDEDMSALYAGAVALVMPTFFGPSNIPALEAWKLNCPVITSDIRGIREQTGNAALLVHPDSVEAITEAILRLWTDEGLRQQLIERGRARLRNFTPEDFARRLTEILEEAKGILKNGTKQRVSH
jgi:glycosyltransferase involved in cell wall biosynthesis